MMGFSTQGPHELDMTEHKRTHTHKETKGKETDEANISDILERDDKELN